jgi:carboxyl-terminal processing protease
MRLFSSGLLALAATVLVPFAARAADDAVKPPQGAYVVVVGVSDTADPTIKPRPTADADAKAVYDLFADKQYFDVAPDRLVLLTSKADEKRNGKVATRENITKAVHEAATKTGKDDVLVLAFFGRGASSGDNTCLFAADTTFKERSKTGVLGSDLETELKAAKQQRLLFLMDIHFKGFDAGKETLVEPTLRDILGGAFGGEEKGELPNPHDRVVMLSTIPSIDPLDRGTSGLFAATLLDALKGKADTEGYEPDGLVTVDELTKYMEKEVADQARTLGKTQKEKEAVPYIVGEEFSHFAITKNPAVTAAVGKRLGTLADLEKAGTITKEVAEEGKGLLARMPKLKAQQDLRKKFQGLTDGLLKPVEFTTAVAGIKAGMVLPEEDAQKYATKVLAAAGAVEARYVKPTNRGELVVAAVRGMYRRLEEAVPADLEAQLKDPKEWKKSKMEDVLKAGRLGLGRREDLDGNKDADVSITMMMASLNDPYTVYYDKEMIKKAESGLRGRFSGVGIQIRRDLVNDALLVATPIKGSPAYKAGIQAGDLIVGIKRDSDPEGRPLTSEMPTEFTTKGMKTEQALDIILGKPGVPVTLVIDSFGEKRDLTIKRGLVTVETVLGVKRAEGDDWKFWLDEQEKIGYIQLTQFAPDTARELYTVVKELKKDGMKGLILDMRFNPGGVLTGAGAICGMFIGDGNVVTVRPRVGEEDVLKANMFRRFTGTDKFTDFPMAVLINGSSASASEIVAACLQDYGRGVVVGERSYGKGSVQTVEPFRATEGEIKMTTARYFPPGNRNIDKLSSGGKPEDEWGVKPDKGFELKLSREEARDLADVFREHEIIPRKDGKGEKKEKKDFKDTQLAKAADYIRDQLKTAKK